MESLWRFPAQFVPESSSTHKRKVTNFSRKVILMYNSFWKTFKIWSFIFISLIHKKKIQKKSVTWPCCYALGIWSENLIDFDFRPALTFACFGMSSTRKPLKNKQKYCFGGFKDYSRQVLIQMDVCDLRKGKLFKNTNFEIDVERRFWKRDQSQNGTNLAAKSFDPLPKTHLEIFFRPISTILQSEMIRFLERKNWALLKVELRVPSCDFCDFPNTRAQKALYD